MINLKKKFVFALSIVMILGVSAFSASAEDVCYPSTPFDLYALDYITRTNTAILQDPGMHVIMVGTGMPWFDAIRNPQCIAIIAGGKFLLFDVGDSATKTMDKLNLPINQAQNVFLTHYHSDHVNDLGHLISHTWVQGRQQPINLYGPDGVKYLTQGIKKASKLDIDIRSINLDRLDPDLAVYVPHEFEYPEDGSPIEVWSENGVVVKAFKNDHYDVEISCGYRVEYAGRVVVISGDTIWCQSVIDNSVGADLLIHEAANKAMVERAACLYETVIPAPLGPALADRIRGPVQHHIDTLEVADVAAQAGVDRLVLTHIMPPVPAPGTFMGVDFEPLFMAGMNGIYTGPIDLATDIDSYYLPPASDVISGPCDGGPCTP